MIEGEEHLRPWILKRPGYPLEQPFAHGVSFLIPVAEIMDQFEQQIALSFRYRENENPEKADARADTHPLSVSARSANMFRLHRPAAPGIEANRGIGSGGIEPDLVDVVLRIATFFDCGLDIKRNGIDANFGNSTPWTGDISSYGSAKPVTKKAWNADYRNSLARPELNCLRSPKKASVELESEAQPNQFRDENKDLFVDVCH
uniref:Uncharacterized protein n=1 Tax=Candidatus Kentrum sp. LFY TaxID=2126342 RepID=A0A450V6X5_9GAMM|nr:MAG: hypothetical protein BECKLFY1418A_GA0070994_11185 [Candidatus Kentron sp. LFY]